MRRFLLQFLLGTLLLIFTLEIAPMPVTAASLIPQAQLSEAIDHFLTFLPSDYYAISTVEALKSIVKSDNAAFVFTDLSTSFVQDWKTLLSLGK
jgi:hypothetical protein